MAELQGLRDYLVQAIKDVDGRMQALTAPRERVMKLLQAQDKRAALLQMAGAHPRARVGWPCLCWLPGGSGRSPVLGCL